MLNKKKMSFDKELILGPNGQYKGYAFPKQAHVFTCLQYKSLENNVRKGEIANNEQFLFSHSVFYPFGEFPAVFIKFEIVVCKLFQFGNV